MKIAILGTKGIPNLYGGFEQFAEDLSTRLVLNGHSVTVYNPSFHTYEEEYFKGVQIRRKFSPEKLIGGAANFIYDHICLKDALNSDFDIIYEAGYHSVALSFKYYNIQKLVRPVVITNMDGLEWMRSKWSPWVRRFIKHLERVTVANCPYLISDNKGIQTYYKKRFNKESYCIPYGANLVEEFKESHLSEYGIRPFNYNVVVARLEPENNVEVILKANEISKCKHPLLIIGNYRTKYGKYLKGKYANNSVLFVGGVYEKEKLNSVRHFSISYFHGHSVGGTNPSLLEAMACRCFIIAHDNEFNRSILEESAIYFKNGIELSSSLSQLMNLRTSVYRAFSKRNVEKIRNIYNWDIITLQYEKLFTKLVN